MPLPGFQRVPAAITDLRAALDAAIAARDRLERAGKVRPGDDPRLLGLVRGANAALRAVADRTTQTPIAGQLGEPLRIARHGGARNLP